MQTSRITESFAIDLNIAKWWYIQDVLSFWPKHESNHQERCNTSSLDVYAKYKFCEKKSSVYIDMYYILQIL